MKWAITLLGCAGALAFGSGSSGALTAGIAQANIGGHEYIRLRDWTGTNGFKVTMFDSGRRALFASDRLHFTVSANSAVAQVNGVNVWLSEPAALRDGAIYVSELDLRTTVQPLIFAAKYPPGRKIKTITLDPGHGGADTGNRVGLENEKKYTLLLALEVRAQLKQAGFTVKMIRTTDKTIDVRDRPAIANQTGADLFVSLHFNASPVARDEVRGAEVYCLTPVGASSTNSKGVGGDSGAYVGNRFNRQNILLAYLIQKSLTANLGVEDRGVRRARFVVLRDTAAPAVLIEAGFMSHPVEGRKIFDPAYRRAMAKAIVSAVLAYRSAVER